MTAPTLIVVRKADDDGATGLPAPPLPALLGGGDGDCGIKDAPAPLAASLMFTATRTIISDTLTSIRVLSSSCCSKVAVVVLLAKGTPPEGVMPAAAAPPAVKPPTPSEARFLFVEAAAAMAVFARWLLANNDVKSASCSCGKAKKDVSPTSLRVKTPRNGIVIYTIGENTIVGNMIEN